MQKKLKVDGVGSTKGLFLMGALIKKIHQKGFVGSLVSFFKIIMRPINLWRCRKFDEYKNPNETELIEIEKRLVHLGINCKHYSVDSVAFHNFQVSLDFPFDYHGGKESGVWNEKLLEHFVAWDLLELGRNNRFVPYIDVAGGASPWAKLLRNKGLEAYSVDLQVAHQYSGVNYYRKEDATKSSFAKESVGSVSLQCAYEMFIGDNDKELLVELMRILKPGGRAVILPLYMHTHPCYYQTPDFFKKTYGDVGAKGYVRRNCWGIPASRKYSPETLKERVVNLAVELGFKASVLVLHSKETIADDIYLHFIFVLEKGEYTDRS